MWWRCTGFERCILQEPTLMSFLSTVDQFFTLLCVVVHSFSLLGLVLFCFFIFAYLVIALSCWILLSTVNAMASHSILEKQILLCIKTDKQIRSRDIDLIMKPNGSNVRHQKWRGYACWKCHGDDFRSGYKAFFHWMLVNAYILINIWFYKDLLHYGLCVIFLHGNTGDMLEWRKGTVGSGWYLWKVI